MTRFVNCDWFRLDVAAAQVAATLLLAACVTPQIEATTQVSALTLTTQALKTSGIAFITPSSVTGQEEDRQALSLAFVEVMQRARPELRIVSLPNALSAINRAGLSGDYRKMLEDYRLTGIFDAVTLRRIGQSTGARYLAQLKLAGFRQESKDRWGTLGLRIFQTKSTVIRLFLQIWDSQDGSIAWEGSVELTSSHDSVSEETVTFRSAIAESAQRLIERMP